MKEYHLFDALHLGNRADEIDAISRRLKNYPPNKHEPHKLPGNIELMQRFYQDPDNYFNYIDSLLKENGQFTTDITPGYSGLSKETFSEIKEGFSRRGIDIKVIFIMREPVSRLESSLRMNLRRNNLLHQTGIKEMTEKIYKGLESRENQLRSNYAQICSRLDRVFSPNELHYTFFETLFSDQEIRKLADFLHLPQRTFDASVKINSTKKSFIYKANDISNFQKSMADRYEFVAERFDFDLSIWDRVLSGLVQKEG